MAQERLGNEKSDLGQDGQNFVGQVGHLTNMPQRMPNVPHGTWIRKSANLIASYSLILVLFNIWNIHELIQTEKRIYMSLNQVAFKCAA